MKENICKATSGDPPQPPELIGQRKFLEKLSVGLGAVASALFAIPVVGFILGPLLQRVPEAWRSLGRVESFKIGETVSVTFEDASPLPWAGVTAKTAAWLRRESEDSFVAFAINCAHLGCPVRWLPDANLFMCPCHGGVYYKDGSVAAGPPPHGLSRYAVRVRNGEVEILTNPVPITT